MHMCRLLYLEPRRLDDASYNAAEPRLADIRPLIYVARATLDNAQLIAAQVKASNSGRWGVHDSSSSGSRGSSGTRGSSGSKVYAAVCSGRCIEWQRQHALSCGADTREALCLLALHVCRAPGKHEFSVFWVPRRSVAVERLLEDEGVYGDISQV